MDERDAWRREHARAAPWAGPVHAAPLLAGLTGRIVELGAGGGKVGAVLPGRSVALDWVREGLRDATRPRVVGDVRALPLATRSVDGLVAIHVLGHLLAPDRVRAVAEWARVLRPDGRVVIEVFEAQDARAGSGEEVEPGTRVRGGIPTHHFTSGELDELFAGWDANVGLEERALRWGTRRVLRGVLTVR